MIVLAKLLATAGILPPMLGFLFYSTADNDLTKANSTVFFFISLIICGIVEAIAGICWLIG